MNYCRFGFPAGGQTPTELDYMEYANDTAARAAYVASDADIDVSSESTTVYQGNYSLGVIVIPGSSVIYVEKTIGTPINISDCNTIRFAVWGIYSGTYFRLKLYDSGAGLILTVPLVISKEDKGKWKEWIIDISELPSASLDSINKIRIEYVGQNLTAAMYIDDLKASYDTIITITSCAPSLPIGVQPVINQIISEAVSGVKQTAELGEKRDTFEISFPHLNSDEFNNLIAFMANTVQWKLKPFYYTYLPTNKSWNVYLDGFDRQDRKGNIYFVKLRLCERIAL